VCLWSRCFVLNDFVCVCLCWDGVCVCVLGGCLFWLSMYCVCFCFEWMDGVVCIVFGYGVTRM